MGRFSEFIGSEVLLYSLGGLIVVFSILETEFGVVLVHW